MSSIGYEGRIFDVNVDSFERKRTPSRVLKKQVLQDTARRTRKTCEAGFRCRGRCRAIPGMAVCASVGELIYRFSDSMRCSTSVRRMQLAGPSQRMRRVCAPVRRMLMSP